MSKKGFVYKVLIVVIFFRVMSDFKIINVIEILMVLAIALLFNLEYEKTDSLVELTNNNAGFFFFMILLIVYAYVLAMIKELFDQKRLDTSKGKKKKTK